MEDHFVTAKGSRLFTRVQGPEAAPPLLFANSLGTNLSLWDPVIALLPERLRIIRYDMRGHGRSDVSTGSVSMGQLVSDAEAICDHYELADAVVVGLSIGGMVAQGLATKRLDLVRGLVLSNTAAKIGNAKLWQDRINAITRDGLPAHADAILDRWFGRDFRHTPQATTYRDMLCATPQDAYTALCAAISGTDFYTPTAALRVPTLGIAGSEDGATPADLVRETIDLIPGSRFEVMRRCGHLPCVEQPQIYASLLTSFLSSIGHLT